MSKGRYSKYIRPISVISDFVLLYITSKYGLKYFGFNFDYFFLFQIIAWSIIAHYTEFYEVFRFTKPAEILNKLVKQFVIFTLVIIAYFSVIREIIPSFRSFIFFILSAFVIITIVKALLFYYLKKYRIILGGNYRRAIIIGYTESAKNLQELFTTRPDYGYRFYGFFSNSVQNNEVKGNLNDIEYFVNQHKIDDVYCALHELNQEELKKIVEFSDYNRITLKFIPEGNELYSKNLKIDYYEFFPVLSLKRTPLQDLYNKLLKRIFDLVFSLFVIVFILSWLIPIVALLIRLESKGPIFFKQGRPGLDQREFFCYKFRSMVKNDKTEESVTRNDSRITKIGAFLRRTSLDEMPQFINVLFGDMSVVGPRPHLWSHNNEYQKKIKKYNVRLNVKPGITGLAQVKGYRGEIETDDEMIHRIKYDVFYIENWSLYLDIKIILLTIINVFKGQEKAY